MCSACGRQLSGGASPAAPAPSQPAPEAQRSPAAGGKSVSEMLGDVTSRWGVERGPVLIAALVLAVVALLAGTYAEITGLTADNGESQADASAWFYMALPMAFGAAALLLLARLEAGPPTRSAATQDQQALYVIGGFSLGFTVMALIKGFDKGLDAESFWWDYAFLFALFAIGLAAVARPVPAAVNGIASRMIGLVVIGVGAVFAVIGALQGQSNDFSTYSMGVTLEDAGFVLMVLSFAWFLGMRKST
jgi:hypothetical protein